MLLIFFIETENFNMKISASIYASKSQSLDSLVGHFDNYMIDYFHIDCNDDPNVFTDIREIKKLSPTPIDLHLITSKPERYFDLIRSENVDLVTFQFENLPEGFTLPLDLGCRIGIALVTETPVNVFDRFAAQSDFILFMATTPGVSGEAFKKDNFIKIHEFKSKYPSKQIHVDGGVNPELSFILRNMGVTATVVGSYLTKFDDIAASILRLKSNVLSHQYRVADFMIQGDDIPVIFADDFQFIEMLRAIEHYKMGFVNVVDRLGNLLGIISNADVRHYLINAKNPSIEAIRLSDVLNENPAVALEDFSVSNLVAYIRSLSFPVLFLPVVNNEGKLCGTIKFNNLIKSEL